MDWKEKLKESIPKLVDMQNSLEADQAGLINYKDQSNTYIFNLHGVGQEQVNQFKSTQITPEIEERIVNRIIERLGPLSQTLSSVSPATRKELILAESSSTAIATITKGSTSGEEGS